MAANFEQGSDARPTGSKLDLIQATVAAISKHGLSELTSAKIAGVAGHTAASINFHFGSKEALLLATLREVSEEFAGAMQRVLEEAGEDDLRALLGIVDASLGRGLSEGQVQCEVGVDLWLGAPTHRAVGAAQGGPAST